jgi:hypothetical protein
VSTTVQQPRAVRAINAVGGAVGRLGLRASLDEDSLVAAARNRTGLTDLGEPSYRDGLVRLIGSLEAEAGLTALGRVAARQRLVMLLETRLRLVEREKREPEVFARPVEKPVFVLGLPRTGTTVLYGMLAADPAMRSPASWEVARPFPAPSGEDPERVRLSQKDLEGFRRIAPGIDAIHPMDARLPQECLAMHAGAFASYEFPTTFPVPSYWAWLRQADMVPAYAFEKRFLQHLQSDWSGRHWVLKTPCHLMWLDALLTVFPDALLVHTHRDPTTVLASVSSLMATMRSSVSRAVDPVAVGREQLDAWTWGMDRVMAVRDALPPGRVVDVRYEDTVADPVGTVHKVYDGLGLDYSADVERAVLGYLAANPRDKHGSHSYSLAEFGLTEAEVARAFAPYNERFGT